MEIEGQIARHFAEGEEAAGKVSITHRAAQQPMAEKAFADRIASYHSRTFWGDGQTYRQDGALWQPQRRAIEFVQAYLACQEHMAGLSASNGHPIPILRRESALVKMPTGTGKTAVIAGLACASPQVARTLIITPRKALVAQMCDDLCFALWRKLGCLFMDGELCEGLSPQEISEAVEGVDSRDHVLKLSHEHYELIERRLRDQRPGRREVVVGTFNALHRIFGLTAPPHRSKFGSTLQPPAQSLKSLKGGIAGFRRLLKSVDLVIVDEGHYEPAYSWAQCIREIDKPTVLLSATPYRNDFKYFQIDGHFTFNLPFQTAVDNKLIRKVRITPPPPADLPDRAPPEDLADKAPAAFVRYFAEAVARVQADPNMMVIVHGRHFDTLRRLQVAFARELGVETGLIHDRVRGREESDPLDLTEVPGLSAEMQARLKSHRHRHVEKARKDDGPQIWLHQYKLLEGIDNSRFSEVWLYDNFGSARQLIQQVGRATRLPKGRGARTTALIKGWNARISSAPDDPTIQEELERRWDDFLAYEKYAEAKTEIVFRAETQLLNLLANVAPDAQYLLGEFRPGNFLRQLGNVGLNDFIVPRRAQILRRSPTEEYGDLSAEDIATLAAEAMQLEERFDIRHVRAKRGEERASCALLQYLEWSNSPYLRRHTLPQWKLGLFVVYLADPYVFMLDTNGNCLDLARLGLYQPARNELKRLFAASETHPDGEGEIVHEGTRVIEATAIGLDPSELAIRKLSVRKARLDDGYFDLAEAGQAPTSIRGYGPATRDEGGRTTHMRNLSMRRASVSDPSSRHVSISRYLRWLDGLAGILGREGIRPSPFFERFAQEATPPCEEDGAPLSLLLDLWDILNPSEEDRESRLWNQDVIDRWLSLDTCLDVQMELPEEDGQKPRYFAVFDHHEIDISYVHRNTVPPRGRYRLRSESLDGALSQTLTGEAPAADDGDQVFGAAADPEKHPDQTTTPNLMLEITRVLNREQAFRIIPTASRDGGDRMIYANGHFFVPSINFSAVAADGPSSPLRVFEVSELFSRCKSEKGDTRVHRVEDWNLLTQFGVMYGLMRREIEPEENDGFAYEMRALDLMVCDDRSTSEYCDFFALNHSTKKIYLIHAKASNTQNPGYSARNLQEVSRQARTSLAFSGNARRGFDMPKEWEENLNLDLKDAHSTLLLDRALTPDGPLGGAEAHAQLRIALSDPSYTTDVVILTTGLFGRARTISAFRDPTAIHPSALQFLYFAGDLQTTFLRSGVRLRIVGNP